MFKLKPELYVHIPEARDYYRSEYSSHHRYKKTLKSIRYFEALDWVYGGLKPAAVARQMDTTEGNLQEQLRRTQARVEQYLKLKEVGAL